MIVARGNSLYAFNAAMPAKFKMAARGPPKMANGVLGFWLLTSTFAK